MFWSKANLSQLDPNMTLVNKLEKLEFYANLKDYF